MFNGKIRSILLAAALLLSLTLAGCAGGGKPAVFGYVSESARFTIEFSQGDGEAVVCDAEKTDSLTTLRVVAPTRSAELRVICSGGQCVITPSDGGEGIPLSSRASERLTNVLALLYRGDDGTATVSRTDGGDETVITYPEGEVTVGSDLMPISVELFGEGGRRVAIRNYEIVRRSENTDIN